MGVPAAQHILVVEDDPGMRTLLMRVLKENGFQVLVRRRWPRRCGRRSAGHRST